MYVRVKYRNGNEYIYSFSFFLYVSTRCMNRQIINNYLTLNKMYGEN